MRKLTGSLLALSAPLVVLCAHAQDAANSTGASSADAITTSPATPAPSAPSSTSNTTNTNATQRGEEQLDEVVVQAKMLSLAGGLMSVQEAPKAVSTISRDAILQAPPGATYSQMIVSIPGVLSITDDVTGLNDGNYELRGFTNDEIGVTVNGAPINDSGNYRVYPTEYGDTENMGDVTVLQGYPDVDQPVAGAAGGTIAWATIDPSHKPEVDLSFSGGSYSYNRQFIRLQSGDTGPVRSWVSFSHNADDLWRGDGNAEVYKADGKSLLTINDHDTISASVQFNHEQKYEFDTITAAQANADYYTSYDTTLESPTDTYYWKLHTNPYNSFLFSLDGEFQLSSATRFSVVPYLQYGGGGGGGGTSFTESTSPTYYGRYGYTDEDIDGNGIVGGKAVAYDLASTYTWRPGAIAKVIQQIGRDDSFELGFWVDEPREQQAEAFSPTDDGSPLEIWQSSKSALIDYSPNGGPQYLYNEYTKSSLRRGFAQDTWTPTDQWTFTAGIADTWEQRKGYDYEYAGATAGPSYDQQFGGDDEQTYHRWTPTAGIKYQPDKANQFYAGYGRTFRAPVNGAVMQNDAVLQYYQSNPGEISYSHITPAELAAIGQNQPEVADTIDVGWRYYGDRLSTSVDAYGSNLKNKQVSGYDSSSGETIYLSVPALHQRGVDAEGALKLTDPLSLYASYSYTESTFGANLQTIGDGYYPVDNKSFLDTPRNVLFLELAYDNKGPYWANINMQYRSAFWADWMNTQKAGGFATLNLAAGWRFHDWTGWLTQPELKLNVENLTDKHALTFDSSTTLLAASGPLDPTTGKALYAAGAYYNLLEPVTYMVTLSASLF